MKSSVEKVNECGMFKNVENSSSDMLTLFYRGFCTSIIEANSDFDRETLEVVLKNKIQDHYDMYNYLQDPMEDSKIEFHGDDSKYIFSGSYYTLEFFYNVAFDLCEKGFKKEDVAKVFEVPVDAIKRVMQLQDRCCESEDHSYLIDNWYSKILGLVKVLKNLSCNQDCRKLYKAHIKNLQDGNQ